MTSAVSDPALAKRLILDELFDLSLYTALREVARGGLRDVLDQLIPVETRHVGFWQEFFDGTPQARFETEEMVVAGDRAVVRWRFDWGSGHVRGIDLFKVRDGKVAEKLSYVKG